MALDAVEHPVPIPSKERPPFDDLRVAPLLDGLAEVAHAAGRPDLVALAAERLTAISQTYAGPVLDAMAALARARARLVAGEPAVEAATAAVASRADAGGAFETGVAHELLAEAHLADGNAAAAELERSAAAAAFASFGAPRPSVVADARSVVEVAGHFAAADGVRTVGLGGSVASVPDLKGLRYIALLLERPGEEMHVLDLVACESGAPRVDQAGLPVLDEVAKAAYRRRLVEVEADLEEARAQHDLAREDLAARDRDYLVAELSQALGLGGRARTVGGSAERARTSVARSIRYSLARLAEQHPAVAAHLAASVLTGTWCRYRPDPLTRIRWTL
jgi:hypothetical protein